jgi:hypothetical protein
MPLGDKASKAVRDDDGRFAQLYFVSTPDKITSAMDIAVGGFPPELQFAVLAACNTREAVERAQAKPDDRVYRIRVEVDDLGTVADLSEPDHSR